MKLTMTDGRNSASKEKCIRHSFNLVEIVLAMAVLAIGISSVLVLFPVGVNANRDAVANNNMADLSEYILATIQSGIEAGWTDSGFDKNRSISFATTHPEDTAVESDFKSSDASARMIEKSRGVFLFRQLTQVDGSAGASNAEYVSDFSAVVQVWEGTFDGVYVAVPEDGTAVKNDDNTKERFAKISKTDDYSNFAKVINVEISWPANLKYEDREKAYYRFESFNNRHKAYSAYNSGN